VPRREVTDADDPAVADFHRLTDVQWRRSLEAEHGLFIAEGAVVIERALAAGHRLRRILTDPVRAAQYPSDTEAEVLVADQSLLARIAGFEVHRGALASFDRPAPLPLADLLATARLLVVLEGLVDPTNVGAVIRSAAAFAADGVLLDPRCADPLYRRSVKVSMGASLQLPAVRAQRWPADLHRVADAGFRVVALAPAAATDLAEAVRGADRLALVLGTEGTGLSTHSMTAATIRARIPMPGTTDSLNVAAAAAVALYEASRR
jgi:tRNA G18 (ribose-2'-O)-methylase SpoU